MKLIEARISLLEGDTDDKGNVTHSKHVALEITDPAMLTGLGAVLDKAVASEHAAAGISEKDALTLDSCADGSKFIVSGKEKLSDKQVEQLKANKKKAEKKPAA